MRSIHLLVVFALLCLPVTAGAAIINLKAVIDGPSAAAGAGTGSAGTGLANITLDDVTNTLTWSGSFSGLGSAYTNSHFHGPALPNQNAGVSLGFGVVLDPGNMSGTFNGNSVLSAGDAAEVLAGLWYINIHSDDFPGGEIRGQVLPEPSALALLAGATALVVMRRRREA